MADITGRFKADFAPFNTAVEQAQVTLKGLETESATVEKSLNRMVDQFSGRKLIQDATLMVQAVERIGGAAKLTEGELARVSAKAAEAATKMRALGLDVPAGLEKYAGAATTAAGATTTLASSTGLAGRAMGGLVAQMAGMATIGFGINLVKGAADLADEIQKVQAQTGMTAEEVQRLQVIAGDTSVSFSALVSTAQNLQAALGRGDKGVTAAIRELGINVEAFQKLNAYEQMRELAEAIGEIEDPTERARLEQAALGKSWKEVSAAMTEDFGKVGDAAWTMSDESAKAFDSFVDDLGNMYRSAKVAIGETIGLLIRAKQATIDWATTKIPTLENATSIQASWGHFVNFMKGGAADLKTTIDTVPPAISEWGKAATTTTPPTQDLARATRDLAEQNRLAIRESEKRIATEAKAAEELAQWATLMEDITAATQPWEEVLATNDELLNAWIQTLLEAGVSIKDISEAYSVSTGIVEANARALDARTAALERQQAAQDELASLLEQYTALVEESTLTTTAQAIAEINRWADAEKGRLMERNLLTAESERMIDAVATERINKVTAAEDKAHAGNLERLNARVAAERASLDKLLADQSGRVTPAMIEAQQQALQAAEDAATGAAFAWTGAGTNMVNSAADAADGMVRHHRRAAQEVVTSWSEAMDLVRQGKGEMSGVVEGGPGTMTNYGPWGSPEHQAAIARAQAEGRYFGPVTTRGIAHPWLGGVMTSGVDWAALGMTPPGGGFRAAGGAVTGGQSYVVGERGPELFVPRVNGAILPNGGSAPVINNTFYVNGTGADVARVVSDELTRLMRVGRKWPAV